jgi:DNA-binding CsgD family transcriptional regulator
MGSHLHRPTDARRGHSTRPTIGDVRALYRLIGDVRSLSGQPVVQRQALVDGTCTLFGADQGFLGEFEDFMPGASPREVSTVPGSQLDDHCVQFMQQWYAQEAVAHDAMGAALYEAAASPGSTVVTWHEARRQMPATQYGGFYELLQTVQIVDILDPMSRHDSGHMVALSLHRLGKSRPFSGRERELAKLLADEMSWLHETRRLNVRDLLGQSLPPRLAELLRHLLTDRGMKHIAAAMGLSFNTARKYGDDLYKRLGVSSREELMFKFLPRTSSR